MGVYVGFDMVPRLGPGEDDTRSWILFIAAVKEYYKNDEQVKVKDHHLLFEAGDGPALPLYGPQFLRFSSKIVGQGDANTPILDYIRRVHLFAVHLYGSRIRFWEAENDAHGFYDWRDVHESSRNFCVGNLRVTASQFANTNDENSDYPMNRGNSNLYETLEIPAKGKGLVARCNIKRGTRILSEKPLFVVQNVKTDTLNIIVAAKLKPLSREQQSKFLSLHNNFPGKRALAGLVHTNALPRGPDQCGIYPEICRINNSCRPNCYHSWNEAVGQETIHALRDIFAGEELTISYRPGSSSSVRQPELKAGFGFDCKCELCSLLAAELAASDARLRKIASLDEQIANPGAMIARPLSVLHACREFLRVVREEYPDNNDAAAGNEGPAAAAPLISRVYCDAMQVAAAHGDQARARVFAERGYRARLECEGEDSPDTRRVKRLMQEPSAIPSFGQCGMKWKTSKTAQPGKEAIGEEGFEKWLWRL
ncbi:uncharacterized protein PG998_006741 [Apiospora kogelbergensis]|uniref:uncharacterized protein n=1 Tax=Apiospora kogelbergensis TaxID=1337665 RepID=UPI00313204F2